MKYLFAFFLLLTICSCTGSYIPSEPGNEDDDSVALLLGVATNPAGSAGSRSIVNDIGTAADEINTVGVYVASGSVTYPGTPDAGTVFTAPTVAGQAWTPTVPVYVNTLAGRLYAWSPATASSTPGTSGGAPTIPVSIPPTQDFDGGNTYGCSVPDYMYGSAGSAIGNTDVINVSRSAFTPAIYMQHALAQVVFTMENAADRPAEPDYDYVWNISCSGAQSTDRFFYIAANQTMSLADGSIGGKTTTRTFAFKCTANPKRSGATGSPAVVAYGLVIPKPETSGVNFTITVMMGGGTKGSNTRTYSLVPVGTAFSGAWQAGHRYTYHLTLGKKNVTIKKVIIEDWNDGGTADGGTMSPEAGS